MSSLHAWSFCLAIFSPQDRLEIFISMFLYLFQPPVGKILISTIGPYLVAIYLFRPFFLQKYLFPKKLQAPPKYSNGGPLNKSAVDH